jgi:hypothetical protein
MAGRIAIQVMGKKIFISYKYADEDVCPLKDPLPEMFEHTTVRDYVDLLQRYFNQTDDLNKAERDGEDLSNYDEDTIWELLKDRIFDSSTTILLISPNMKEDHRRDSSQWIPWEISYSLRRVTRDERTSQSNAILAVVLPDRRGSYSYYLNERSCNYNCSCTRYNNYVTFDIVAKNMFNRRRVNASRCSNGVVIHSGESSYIKVVKWVDFAKDPQSYIDAAAYIMENIEDYNISVEV